MAYACDEKPVQVCVKAYEVLFSSLGLPNRDFTTLELRTKEEGLSFLTKCLPLLGKALLRGLRDGFFNLPCCFKRRQRGREIPAFCGSLFAKVFNASGCLRLDACPKAVKDLSQVLFLFYKLELPFEEELVEGLLSTFIDTDNALEDVNGDHPVFVKARELTSKVFGNFAKADIVPSHGKGVVSNIAPTDKWNYYPPVSKVIKHFGRASFNNSEEAAVPNLVQFCCALLECNPFEPYLPYAKVICVPKDSRGPRIISCEPSEHQWIQQGLRKWTQAQIESHPISRGCVNFEKQGVNQQLVREGSVHREYSTLDLKDASDRISLDLVTKLFSDSPDYLESLLASRSEYTEVPLRSGSVCHKLKKFAPMGSAVCFTTLAWSIYSLLVGDLLNQGLSLAEAKECVYVYGDDIVVETWYGHRATSVLEFFGLLVNKDKSFINSRFLESCGVECFDGVETQPVRAKCLLSSPPKGLDKWQAHTRVKYDSELNRKILGTLGLARNLALHGYHDTAEYFYSLVERWLRCPLPYGSLHSPFLCRLSADTKDAWRMNSLYGYASKDQSVRAFTIRSKDRPGYESPWGRLRRTLPQLGIEFLTLPEMGWYPSPRRFGLQQTKLKQWYDTAYCR